MATNDWHHRFSPSQFDVLGPHAGKGPKNWKRSDDRIRDDVCDMLERDSHIDASEIEVSVKDQIVFLNGTIESRIMKRHAENLIENIYGVLDIQNNLNVDQNIFERAKEMLLGETAANLTGRSNGRPKPVPPPPLS
jgi:hypothetical protein